MWSPLGTDNDITRQIARWQPEPSTRGSYNILSTCLITLSLCVWTCLHLNVPEHGKSARQLWRKTKWLAIGLVAPEIVAFAAFRQWQLQRDLIRKIAEALGDLNPSPSKPSPSTITRMLGFFTRRKAIAEDYGTEMNLPEDSPTRARMELSESGRRRFTWTATHGFFAIMGGFAFDNSANAQVCPLPGGRRMLTISPDALVYLAKHEPDILPDIPLETIQDKSKASQVAKTLVCIQATWFCLQFISRLGFGLAVTLLELNTFAHAICALIIYVVWWDKPLDIDEAIAISTSNPRAAAMCAAMCLLREDARSLPCWGRRTLASPREPVYTSIFKRRVYGVVQLSLGGPGSEPSTAKQLVQPPRGRPERGRLTTREIMDSFGATTNTSGKGKGRAESSPQPEGSRNNSSASGNPIALEYRESHGPFRFDAFSQGAQPAGYINYYINLENDSVVSRLYRLVREDANATTVLRSRTEEESYQLVDRITNWPFDRDAKSLFGSVAYFTGFTVAAALYGGWHLTAWNGPFRSHTEELLWKISAIGVGLTGLMLEALVLTSFWILAPQDGYVPAPESLRVAPSTLLENLSASEAAAQQPATREEPRLVLLATELEDGLKVLGLVLISLCLSFVLAIPVCRAFLVVEPFIGLPYVADSAFALPNWASYFPHIN